MTILNNGKSQNNITTYNIQNEFKAAWVTHVSNSASQDWLFLHLSGISKTGSDKKK